MVEYAALTMGEVFVGLGNLVDLAWRFMYSWRGLVALLVLVFLYAMLRRR